MGAHVGSENAVAIVIAAMQEALVIWSPEIEERGLAGETGRRGGDHPDGQDRSIIGPTVVT